MFRSRQLLFGGTGRRFERIGGALANTPCNAYNAADQATNNGFYVFILSPSQLFFIFSAGRYHLITSETSDKVYTRLWCSNHQRRSFPRSRLIRPLRSFTPIKLGRVWCGINPHRTELSSLGDVVARFDVYLRSDQHKNPVIFYEDAEHCVTKWMHEFIGTFLKHTPSRKGDLFVARNLVELRKPMEKEYRGKLANMAETDPGRRVQRGCGLYTAVLTNCAFYSLAAYIYDHRFIRLKLLVRRAQKTIIPLPQNPTCKLPTRSVLHVSSHRRQEEGYPAKSLLGQQRAPCEC